MRNLLPPLPSLPALSPPAPSGSGALLPASGCAGAFGQVLAQVSPRSGLVQAQEGDSLIGLVKAHYRQNQQPITEHQAMRLAHQVAARNQIDNPNLILNLTPNAHTGYRVGLPVAGVWKELLNSDAAIYGGSNVGNPLGVTAEDFSVHNQRYSAMFTLPPMSVSVFGPA